MRFKKLQQSSFLILLTLISIAFIWIVNDFIMPIFWAVVFAIIFQPIHKWWLSITNNRKNTSSALTLLSVLLIVFIPLSIIGSLVFNESVDFYQQITDTQASESITINIFDRFQESAKYLNRFGMDDAQIKDKLLQLTETSTNWLTSQIISFGQGTFSTILQSFVMLYILFFLLRDGDKITKRLIELLPFGDRKEKRLLAKFSSTTRAVIKGTFVVGIVQGGIGTILFLIAGINGAILWGVLMMLLSVIPALGASIVWLPAGVILLLTGNLWQGVVVLAGGVLIISLIDNILRPILVGKDTKTPDAIILISTLGGLSIFGITGFVIGPIIAGFFLAMWEMFEEEYHRELRLHG